MPAIVKVGEGESRRRRKVERRWREARSWLAWDSASRSCRGASLGEAAMRMNKVRRHQWRQGSGGRGCKSGLRGRQEAVVTSGGEHVGDLPGEGREGDAAGDVQVEAANGEDGVDVSRLLGRGREERARPHARDKKGGGFEPPQGSEKGRIRELWEQKMQRMQRLNFDAVAFVESGRRACELT